MATRSPHSSSRSEKRSRFTALQLCSAILAGVAIVYALLAGLHTLQDFDLGWQLATGRWVVQHRGVFSTDVFSYTANGQPWIYPVLSGVVFYLAFLAGGYALLSWMGALACAGTVVLLVRRENLITCALAVIAVPLIANRTQPRAEMFSTLLFAAFLSLLWRHYRTGQARIWLLPILMVGWVNLHLGFVAGLALCGAYVLLEVLDMISAVKRSAALLRLRRAWPWLALTAVATLADSWGAKIYAALFRQARAQSLHNSWIVEWGNVRLSWASLHQAGFHQAISWREPESGFWWLLLAAALGTTIAVWRRHWGAAILLVVSAILTIQHVRLQALFACIVVVIGGAMFDDELRTLQAIKQRSEEQPNRGQATARSVPFVTMRLATASVLVLTVTISIASLAIIRSWDLISNRYYMRSAQLALFGTGLSWWFPQRAVEFVQREHLPGNVFNGYSLGGYLTWQLFPAYPDYIDGRAIPFGPQLFFRAYELSVQPPDSTTWRQEADARGINTILVPLGRYQGMTLFPQLHAFCRSQSWRPVYMDEVSAIFVRHTPQTSALIDRLQVDCDKISLTRPVLDEAQSSRAKAELFNAYANAGGVLYSLERYPEALAVSRSCAVDFRGQRQRPFSARAGTAADEPIR